MVWYRSWPAVSLPSDSASVPPPMAGVCQGSALTLGGGSRTQNPPQDFFPLAPRIQCCHLPDLYPHLDPIHLDGLHLEVDTWDWNGVWCPGVSLPRRCCHWGPSGPLSPPDPPLPHHGLVLIPTPSARPCRRPRCQVLIPVLPVSRCCGCLVLPVPQCYGFSVLWLPNALTSRLHAAPGSLVPEVPGPPCSPISRISWLPDAPCSLEPRHSRAPGFPVSLCCSFPVVPACGCPQFYRFPMPIASRFPGAATPNAPGSPVPTVFPLPGARFSRSPVTCFPMFLVLQLSSAHG